MLQTLQETVIMFFVFFPFLHPQNWPYMLAMVLALAVLLNGRRYPWLFAALGGFLLGQMIGKLGLVAWEQVPLFWLSAALGAVLAALSLAAARPVSALASFLGLGFGAYTLCSVLGLGSPWNLVAFAAAGALATAALFRLPQDHALVYNSALSAAGAIAATLIAWIAYVALWNGWSAVVIGAIAAVVGIIHQMRAIPSAAAAPTTLRVPRPAV
jgi:hypothetical protein